MTQFRNLYENYDKVSRIKKHFLIEPEVAMRNIIDKINMYNYLSAEDNDDRTNKKITDKLVWLKKEYKIFEIAAKKSGTKMVVEK